MQTVKPITEIVSNFEELVKLVHNGRIIFSKKGGIEFYKDDFITTKEIEMHHTDYGYKAERDWELQRSNVPRNMTFPAGTKGRMKYAVCSDYVLYEIFVETKQGMYRNAVKKELSSSDGYSEFFKQMKSNEDLWPIQRTVDYNCIGSFYVHVTNGVPKFSN